MKPNDVRRASRCRCYSGTGDCIGHERRVGFRWDPMTKVLYLSAYLEGGRGLARKRVRVHAEDEREADRLYVRFLENVGSGGRRVNPSPPTFGEFVDAYFEESITPYLAAATAREYRYVIKNELKPAFAGKRLDHLRPLHINAWKVALRKRELSPYSINTYVNIFLAIVGYAAQLEVIDASPFANKSIRKEKTLPLESYLSDEEEARFLAAFDDEAGFRAHLAEIMPKGEEREIEGAGTGRRSFGGKRRFGAGMKPEGEAARGYFERYHAAKNLFIVALETGLRRGDLLGLQQCSLDFGGGVVRLTMGKTQRKLQIAMSDRCRAALEAACRESAGSEFVFADRAGGAIGEARMRRYFSIAKKLAGITRRLRIHDLRHSVASRLRREGADDTTVQHFLGHTNASTTKRYMHLGSAEIERQRALLNRRGQVR